MENNEKLLEAARMLKSHCEGIGFGETCLFADGGECTGAGVCLITCGGCGPSEWEIDESRWSPADKSLAAGLKANGYNSVTRMLGSESVFVIGASKTALELGRDFFANLACNEVVNLDDIIGEAKP